MRAFSTEATEWLQNYHGSLDSTAILMAFDAGQQCAQNRIEQRFTEWVEK